MPGFAKMTTSASARMHARAQLGYFTSTGQRRGYTRGRDKRRRERTAVSGLCVTLMKEQLEEQQAETYCHFDTQNTKNETSLNIYLLSQLTTNATLHVDEDITSKMHVGTKQSNPFHPPDSFRSKAQEGAPA